ncbi:Uncharacterised protein [Mycobacteroides abscessus subsp. abscessus]|nr:Uncharacterised protein [Mycobacteroides abscessus subsp. abscessus]
MIREAKPRRMFTAAWRDLGAPGADASSQEASFTADDLPLMKQALTMAQPTLP